MRQLKREIVGLSDDYLAEVVAIYQRIWLEPPWLEFNWKTDAVAKYLAGIIPEKKGLVYTVLMDGKVAGFTAGWPIDRYEFYAQSGTKIANFFVDQEPAFYIAELGVSVPYRGRGIGHELISSLLDAAKSQGFNRFALRTHVYAEPARRLYRRLGFHETSICHIRYPNRTYWVRLDC